VNPTPITLLYISASFLFIFGLRGLSHPESARRGILCAEIGMALAVVGTLLNHEIVRYEWIIAGLILGSFIGSVTAWVPITAMPQRIALSHAGGALAATLVGVAEYLKMSSGAAPIAPFTMFALGFEVLFGALTVTGSLMAFAKLQELMTGVPIVFKGQNILNIGLFCVAAAIGIYLVFDPSQTVLFFVLVGLALVLGVFFVMPIGGADMPTVISILNAYAGLAGSATGFVLGNNVLIIAGALDGASGLILSIIMCKAMNRSFSNVIFGAFGQVAAPTPHAEAKKATVQSMTPEEAAVVFKAAKSVIVVPGYGMAVAQAQHAVQALANLLNAQGTTVKYAIHPVAGRMPGHMNVLLAEANVSYDKLIDMDDINPEFAETDIALVIGANDVVNPAAKTDPASPIYGMPILEVEQSKKVFVLKRGMSAGFAGIDNELFIRPNTTMVFGDAKGTITKITAALTNGAAA
jgi:NAD(P) transhydrogenase subunit beta